MSDLLMGIDIGGTNLKYGVVDSLGNIIHQASKPTIFQNGIDSFIADMIGIIDEIRKDFDVNSIGIGVPGVVSGLATILVSPNLPILNGINLRKAIEEHINIPIYLDNDANAAAIAELEIGAGKDVDDFIYITLGTGVGGTIISNRKIFRGSTGGAGEIGHTIIKSTDDLPIPDDFRKGTLEDLTGRHGILSRMNFLIKMHGSILAGKDKYDVSDISLAADKNDKAAIICLKETGNYLGVGIASAMNLLDIPIAVIGGGISGSSELMYVSILKTIKQRALPTIAERAEIRKAYFKKAAGLVGAAILGSQSIKDQE